MCNCNLAFGYRLERVKRVAISIFSSTVLFVAEVAFKLRPNLTAFSPSSFSATASIVAFTSITFFCCQSHVQKGPLSCWEALSLFENMTILFERWALRAAVDRHRGACQYDEDLGCLCALPHAKPGFSTKHRSNGVAWVSGQGNGH